MRDLRYQVADAAPDDRHREALRSVKRQMDRFTERSEPESVQHADNILQSAIQQIRARHLGMSDADAAGCHACRSAPAGAASLR